MAGLDDAVVHVAWKRSGLVGLNHYNLKCSGWLGFVIDGKPSFSAYLGEIK